MIDWVSHKMQIPGRQDNRSRQIEGKASMNYAEMAEAKQQWWNSLTKHQKLESMYEVNRGGKDAPPTQGERFARNNGWLPAERVEFPAFELVSA